MARSLSLAAYLAYARGGSGSKYSPQTPRPDGTLIWAHAVEPAHAKALIELQERLLTLRPDLTLLLTKAKDLGVVDLPDADQVIAEVLPDDTVASAEAFLAHWRPDLALWTGGDLKPALLTHAAESHIPLGLVDAAEPLLTRAAWRWFPDLPRSILRSFDFVMTRDEPTSLYLKRIGVWNLNMSISGPFLDGPIALPYNQSDREELALVVLGRPVWLAAESLHSEFETVLTAHREITKLSHRAMLIVVPANLEETAAFKASLEDSGLRFIEWSSGEFPEETTQVILADTDGEMGLWYRLAPISFMGRSLDSNAPGSDPNQPAAHGSAILYGPHIGDHLEAYARFAEAGGARIVRDAETLASTVKRLIPPDQSATMAHAAWDVASRSAALIDKIADKIHEQLDRAGVA
ncbi:3-deoxy-D-manno-octulosonic acid transferase [Roseovarius phycicola]|uniref:3-deoxy-D-manno-octulosonic acid transferase n=1 Tax=Roseovarius phycicola TaxID=3080976 RepID=A0ABZ2HIQ4_9RHOB